MRCLMKHMIALFAIPAILSAQTRDALTAERAALLTVQQEEARVRDSLNALIARRVERVRQIDSVLASITPAPTIGEPNLASFSLITQRDFGAKVEQGWLDRGDAAFSIQSISDAPRADKQVGQALFVTGFAAGSGPINTYYNIGSTYTKLHVQLWLRVSSNWEGQQASINKVLYIWQGAGPSIYLNLQGTSTNPLYFRVSTHNFQARSKRKIFHLDKAVTVVAISNVCAVAGIGGT